VENKIDESHEQDKNTIHLSYKWCRLALVTHVVQTHSGGLLNGNQTVCWQKTHNT